MSVYADKIYPIIEPTAPVSDQEDSQSYRLKKIDEAERLLRAETETRDKLAKQFKR